MFFLIKDERVKVLAVTPEAIYMYNVDETGCSGKEQPRQKVIGVRGRQAIQVKVIHTSTFNDNFCTDNKHIIVLTAIIKCL